MNRRDFLVLASGVTLGGCNFFSGKSEAPYLRFAVASDGHYGEPGADYDVDFRSIISSINAFHEVSPLDFVMINGDISHDIPDYLHKAKSHLDTLNMPYKVSKGNHDRMDEPSWSKLWGVPFDYSFSLNNDAFITLNTSDLAGTYLCPNYKKLEQMLDQTKAKNNVFLFMHINPVAQTRFAVECGEFVSLVKSHRNVRGVFNGHDHDHDDIILFENIPFIFDGHFGGTWGTGEKGYRVVECFDDGRITTFMMSPSLKQGEQNLT